MSNIVNDSALVKGNTFPFSPYFPATEKDYNDPVAVKLWHDKTEYIRNHCNPKYVLMRTGNEEFYVPRLPIGRREDVGWSPIELFDTSGWQPTAGDIEEFELDNESRADWEGWREHRGHRYVVAHHSAPTAEQIEDILTFDPRDPVYIESCRQQDERLLIQEIKARHHGDLDFKVTPEMIAEERASQEERQRILVMEREAKERAERAISDPSMSAFDKFKIRAVYDLSNVLDLADECEFSAGQIAELRSVASPWSAARAESRRIQDKTKVKEADEKLRKAEELRRYNDEWSKRRQQMYAEQGKVAPELPQPKVEPVCMATMAGKKAPPQPWVVPNLIPGRNVTLLTADGSVGKSLLALQLLASIAIGREWIGETTLVKGPTIFFTAEDEFNEVWRRTEHICEHERVDIASMKHLHILPYAGRDAILASFDKKTGAMIKTQGWQDLVKDIQRLRPKVIAVDTLADAFGGSELERAQARAFVSGLRGLAMEYDCAVIVLAHPSLSGMADGSGRSGSTGWGNSVRSRILFSRVLTGGVEMDRNARTLTLNKTNYAERGFEIKLSYSKDDDVFVREQSSDDGTKEEKDAAADAKFLELLAEFMRQGRTVSDNSRAGNYAPKLFAGHPNADGIGKRALEAAMERLLSRGAVKIVPDGRAKTKIVPAGFEEPKEPEQPTAAHVALTALEQVIVAHGVDGKVTVEQWRAAAYAAGISNGGKRSRERAFKKASEVVIEDGMVIVDDGAGIVWLGEK
jgi:RecA-family ATPase